MIRSLVIAFCCFFLPTSLVHAQTESGDSPADLVTWTPWSMTASEIQSTGAVRLSELFRMMPTLETWSSDRYTQRIVGMGLGGIHPDPVDITLDGVSIPAFMLDRALTESLPVSPGDLTSLSYSPQLGMAGPARKTDGRIALRTPMRTGWHASGALAVINETGDPGPAKHTDARAKNVDRSGPATWLRSGWGNGAWMIQAGLNTDLHHLTDERISGRVRGTYAENVQPVITQFAPFARIRHESENTRFHAMGGQSRRKDFVYHESAGREWPARLRRTWAAALLERQTAFASLSLRADASRNAFSDRPSFIALPSALQLEEASVEGSLTTNGAHWRGRVAVGARTWVLKQGDLKHSMLTPAASAKIARTGSTWSWNASFDAAQLADESWQPETFSWLASTALSYLGERGSLALNVSGTKGHFPEPGHLLTWSLGGVDLAEWLPSQALPDQMTTPQTWEVGLLGRRALSNSWHGWAHAHVRLFHGMNMPDRTIDQRFGIGPLLPEWRWSAGHAGWLFSRTIGLERLETDRILWRAFFQFYHVSSQGDDVFFRHQTGFPRHRFQVMASDTRPGGFRWMTRLGYASAWTWPEYREPARREAPADIVAEVTIGKTLFSGFADALISLLNVPDRSLGVHPAGVEEQLAIRLTLSVAPVSRMSGN